MTSSEYIQHHLHNLDINILTGKTGSTGFWTLHLDTLIISWILG